MRFQSTQHTRKTRAFTLSEVLITLTIIGVVAAITIPTLQIQHQKEQTVIQFKKAYSDFANAALLASVEYGDFTSWDYNLTSSEFFKKYFYPYISLSKQKISDAKKDNIIYYQTSGQVENQLLIMRDQGEIVEMASGCQIFTYPLVYGEVGEDRYAYCYAVDINGYKKPNKFGRDLFMLCISSEKGVTPHYWDDNLDPVLIKRTRNQLLKGPSSYNYNCSKKARGMWCGALIMYDNWQIKDDYPW